MKRENARFPGAVSCLLAVSIAAVAASPFIALSRQNEGPQRSASDESIRVRSEEVVVDLIVTDRNGKPVVNLDPADFEIYEDGVKQQIRSFRLESRSRAASTESGKDRPSSEFGVRVPLPKAHLVSLVFDTTGTARDGALLARHAAEEYVRDLMEEESVVAVFGTGISMHIFQPFTKDRPALLKAIEEVTSGDMRRFGSISSEIRTQLETIVGGLSEAEKTSAAYDDATSYITRAAGQAAEGEKMADTRSSSPVVDLNTLALASLRTLLVFQRYEREYQGRMNVSGLLSIIDAQRVFSGRKTIIYFSSGFMVAPNMAYQFRSVVSAANRANVTIYAIDTAGLRLESSSHPAGLEAEAIFGGRGRNPNPDLVVGGRSALGRVEEVARMDTVSNLDELSTETGGYTVKNTNDLKTGLRRIVDDLNEYYVLTYSPTNSNFDGRFRRISVKVRPPDLTVRSRSGYYAFRSRDSMPVLSFEAPLLEMLNASPAASDFPIAMGGYHFLGKDPGRVAALFVQFPMSAIKVGIDKKKRAYEAFVDAMILLKEPGGAVLRKLSREFSLDGSLDQLDQVLKREVSFLRTISLAPGQYTLEAVVRDRLTGKGAVRKEDFQVAPVESGKIQISSLVLSKHAVPASESEKGDRENPFVVQASASVMPDLWRVYRKSSDKLLLLFFTVYPPQPSESAVEAILEFVQNGKPQARAQGTLPAADADGRVQYVTTFGLENFEPGEYSLQVTVKDGRSSASAQSNFRVEP